MLHDSLDRSHELTAPTISFRIYLHFSHRTTNDRGVTNFATFGADSFPSRANVFLFMQSITKSARHNWRIVFGVPVIPITNWFPRWI